MLVLRVNVHQAALYHLQVKVPAGSEVVGVADLTVAVLDGDVQTWYQGDSDVLRGQNLAKILRVSNRVHRYVVRLHWSRQN